MNKIVAQIMYQEIRDENPDDGLYVWVDPDELSVLKLQKLMRGAPFRTVNSTAYHTTVLFHKGELPFGLRIPNDGQCRARVTGLKTWTEADGEKIVVALLDSPDLQTVHQELLKEGLTHSFPEYNAHITLGKKVKLDAVTRLWLHGRNEYLAVSDFYITFDPKLKASSLA
jgi:hypothetical protein